MRSTTFVLSFFVHAAMIAATIFVRIFAATELPVPPFQTAFVAAAPDVPPAPPAAPAAEAPARSEAAAPTVNLDAAPLVEPLVIAPDLAALPDTAPAGPGVMLGAGDVPSGLLPGPPAPPAIPADPRPPVRPGGVVSAPRKVHHVAPVYPEIARSARVEGIVFLEALIDDDGTVREVKVLRSHPLLDGAAVEAVRQWRFTPTLLNGVPVQVIMTVTVNFMLK